MEVVEEATVAGTSLTSRRKSRKFRKTVSKVSLIKCMFFCCFCPQQLREFDQDDLNVQLEIFDDQKEEDALEFQHRFNDIAIHLEYPFQASIDFFICIRSNDNKGLCLSWRP